MKRDHLMGYPPAAGATFGSHPWWDQMLYPLGLPRRMRDMHDAMNKQWAAEKARPVLTINHRNLTAVDMRGIEARKAETLARMHEQAAATGQQVMCKQTFRTASGVTFAETHAVNAPAVL